MQKWQDGVRDGRWPSRKLMAVTAALCLALAAPFAGGSAVSAAAEEGHEAAMPDGSSRDGGAMGMRGGGGPMGAPGMMSGQGAMGMPMAGPMMGAPMMGGQGMAMGMPMAGTPMMAGGMMSPYVPYAYGPGTMMGLGMMRFGMGPGMIRGLGLSGYLSNEAVQKFLDETKDLRKELHDLMFDYAEVLRQPKVDREQRIAIENKIQALRQRIYEKAPRYQFWPY